MEYETRIKIVWLAAGMEWVEGRRQKATGRRLQAEGCTGKMIIFP